MFRYSATYLLSNQIGYCNISENQYEKCFFVFLRIKGTYINVMTSQSINIYLKRKSDLSSL
jgi:hypothetical protein